MKKVAFLVGSAHVSGGTYVIFQHALYLKRAGVDVTILTEEVVQSETVKWHEEALNELSFKTYSEVQSSSFDIAIATWWRTVFSLHRVEAKSYLYFIQSIESRFYTEADVAAQRFVESTYCLGLPSITEAVWIKDYLDSRFAANVALARNGIRKDLYTDKGEALSPRQPGRLRVLVEGPLGVFFKNTERTLELCSQSKADEIWFLTSSPGCVEYPWVDRLFCCVPIAEVPAIYRSCDVLIKLSYVEGMFGPPLEMFHCGGTAIVYNVTGHDEYIADRRNGVVIPRDDEERVIRTINKLRDDCAFLESLKQGARETGESWPDWPEASRVFMDQVLALAQRVGPTKGMLAGAAEVFSSWYEKHSSCQAQIAQLEGERSHLAQEVRAQRSQLDMILSSGSFRTMQRIRDSLGARVVKKLCGRAA